MIYKNYKNISLSALGMGNMRLPLREDLEGKPIDRQKAQEIIDFAMDKGINYYDTAYVYNNGDSERFLGEAMSKYKREDFYLATKFNIGANPDYRAVFEEQCKRLNTEYFDFYLVHAVMDHNFKKYEESGCIEYFKELKKQGRIKYLGFSSHGSPQTLRYFRDLNDWDFIQLQLNYYDYIYGSAKEEYEICTEKGIPVVVMEPVRGGRLAELTPEANRLLKSAHPDWSIAAWAFRWVKSLPNVQVVLSGMSDMEQIRDNINTFSDAAPMSEEDRELLTRACGLFRQQMQVACTKCRYCCDDCPAGIDIPDVLMKYNEYKLNGDWALEGLRKSAAPGPADCVGCKKCTGHCPQSINVPEIMAELKEKISS
ncbi:MAG: aldo/keto reductase [Firmicutes bacterium]|nr:aldo/keto reductase [[Eubacterium] siraeum]MCM1489148.1 aldo/keto reductase [Bacillota bacterium]